MQNHHLVVPFSEIDPIKKLGLSKTPSLHDNVIIEGDNLKALKALLPTYHGKVKCIYIDPPYNTGNEGWIYNDRVNSPMMRDWLGKTVDRDDLTRHDKWCCMMLPRLKLLREFLTDDGAIFVSIDDNEVHHLRALMDEVFGEENFVANVVWRSADSSNNDAKQFSVDHNHTVVYSRQRGWLTRPLKRTEDDNAHYTNPDDDPNGPWFPGNLSSPNPRENLRYLVKSPSGKKIKPPANGWRWKKETLLEMIESGEVVFSEDETRLIRKTYLKEQTGLAPSSLWDDIEETGHNRNAKYVLKNLFPEKATADLFKTPKPVKFLLKILRISTEKDSIILDSFAGSGTTAHAVLALNKEDGGNRRFILCQMPFETKEEKDKNENICESITAERVRRVIKGVKASKAEALRKGLGGTFSYFRLGKELRKQAILDGKDMPRYEALAGYVFFTATGEEFDSKKVNRDKWFIGTSRDRDVFLIYEEDIEKLKDMALNLDLARKLGKAERKKLVFAPTKYLDQEYLDRLNIEFCQLPFEIYQRATKK